MKTMTFSFAAGPTTASWIVPRDVRLQGIGASGGASFIVSDNPALLSSDFTGPGATVQRQGVYFGHHGSSGNGDFRAPANIPVAKGQTIYVNCSGSGSVILYYD
jgi:hypothetical protein